MELSFEKGSLPKYVTPISSQRLTAVFSMLSGRRLKINPAMLLGVRNVRKPFITAPIDAPIPLQSMTMTAGVPVSTAVRQAE